MAQLIIDAIKSATIDSLAKTFNDHSSTSSRMGYQSGGTWDYADRLMLVGFGSIANQYKTKILRLSDCMLVVPVKKIGESIGGKITYSPTINLSMDVLESAFNEATVTYNTKPDDRGYYPSTAISSYLGDIIFRLNSSTAPEDITRISNYGIQLTPSGALEAYTSRHSYPPKMYLNFEDEDNYIDIYGCTPSSGYISKHEANHFSWGTRAYGYSLTPLTVSNNEFEWRPIGGATTTVNCGNNSYYDMPADTISTSAIEWRVKITNSFGNINYSDWMQLSTAEALSSARAISPANAIIDGSAITTFAWEHIISTGTAPTASELQYSADQTTWSTLATVTGNELTADIPANTFTSGQWYWRVRTYNSDELAGSWSEPASFISVASPVVQGVITDNMPRPTISWQSVDQRGYQVRIDDIVDSGVIYGAEYSWKSPTYLTDGTYVVQVRVQNAYGFWSAWVASSLVVNNTAGPAIELSGATENGIVGLSWITDPSYDGYIVYRDNRAIAKATNGTFTDNFALGSCKYLVRGIYNDSTNYGISNTLSLNITVGNVWISAIDYPNWMPLYYSNIQTDETIYLLSGDSRTYHISGADYPVVETSRFKNKYLSGRCAFISRDEANAFEALTGRIVVCKMPDGEMIVGALENVQKMRNEFFTGFSFSITHTALNEDIVL